MKVIKINKCAECPYFERDLCWCIETEKNLNDKEINIKHPDWCPLEEY